MSERERRANMRKSSLGDRSRLDTAPEKKKVGVDTESALEDRSKIESLSELSPAEERESVEFERDREESFAFSSERLPELPRLS